MRLHHDPNVAVLAERRRPWPVVPPAGMDSELLLDEISTLPRPVPEHATQWQQASVERVIRVMRERLDDPLTLNEMAEIAHLSRFHFNRVFSTVTGVSPRKFLATLRLEYAKRLLLKTSMSITEVCFETGYSSLGTFTSHFTNLVGVTPSKWRRLPVDLTMPLDRVVELVAEARQRVDHARCSFHGSVTVPTTEDSDKGLVFVGLFERQIPESLPVTGDLLVGDGEFHLPAVCDGAYYVLAVSIPLPLNQMDFYLPEMMLRDASKRCQVREGRYDESVCLELREPRITDPPILIALPYLFAAYLRINGMSFETAT